MGQMAAIEALRMAFPLIKSTGLTSEEFAEKLLFEEKVVAILGSASGGYNHIRR
jgi:aminotransferase